MGEPRIIDGYARALLDVARAEGDADRVADEVFRIARAISGSDELRETLTDLRVPVERKQAVVTEVLDHWASPVSIALVNLLVGAGRTADLVDIANRTIELAAEEEGRVVAEVRTAVELDGDTLAELEQRLGEATGKRVEAKVVVDPSIIGGVVAKIGDTIFDGSVRSRLQELREAWG